MKNILNEKPSAQLVGRLFASANFVNDNDIKKKSVLDIGCGYGWCELNFLNRGVSQITGIEITESDLDTIRENIKDNRLKLVVSGATKLPFEDESFDTVVSWEVLEHIPKRTEEQMFSEVYRVLKPNGCFYLSTPRASFWSNFTDPAWWLVGHRHYSERRLLKIASISSFQVLKLERKGRCWTILSLLNMYFAKWIFRKSLDRHGFIADRSHREYLNNNGFVNIFVKMRKRKIM